MDPATLEQLSPYDLIALLLALEARHAAEMERRLSLNSSNSGKPPSSDGLKKPVRVSSLREPSGKKPGGQKGHPGETLCRTETPDAIIDHYPPACARCGALLTEAMATSHVARQEFDLPEPQPLIVTEHRAHDCRCAACGAQTRAAFPDWVAAPVQYGKRIGAVVLYLLHYQLLPEKRLATLMADLFGVRLATATIARISHDCAERFKGFVNVVRDQVAVAPVKHMDRLADRRQHAMAAYRLDHAAHFLSGLGQARQPAGSGGRHRGARPLASLLHDDRRVARAMQRAPSARTEGAGQVEKEDWAGRMQRLLRRACHAVNLAHAQDLPLRPEMIARIERCYDAIVADGLAYHRAQPALSKAWPRGPPPRRVGHNLLLRLRTRKADVLRFLTDPSVPFTNNLAERDGRMMKLRQKISGGFRSEQGAADFAGIRSLILTARKQGWDLLQTLTAEPAHLIATLRSA